MLQAEWIFKIKKRIESAEQTKEMYPEFTKSQNKIIKRLKNELKTLNYYNKKIRILTRMRKNSLK